MTSARNKESRRLNLDDSDSLRICSSNPHPAPRTLACFLCNPPSASHGRSVYTHARTHKTALFDRPAARMALSIQPCVYRARCRRHYQVKIVSLALSLCHPSPRPDFTAEAASLVDPCQALTPMCPMSHASSVSLASSPHWNTAGEKRQWPGKSLAGQSTGHFQNCVCVCLESDTACTAERAPIQEA